MADYAKCQCGKALQWDWCQDSYFDPETGKYMKTEGAPEGSLSCVKCSELVDVYRCDCGAVLCTICSSCAEVQTDQPQLEDVNWEMKPNYVEEC